MAAGGLTGVQKTLLISAFLITGSINTLTKKWQFQTCGPTEKELTQPEAAEPCPDGEKQFHKPWTQNIQMFLGEAMCFMIFLVRRPARLSLRQLQEEGGTHSSAPFYIFLLPACCDVLGTGVGGIGMLYISASVWQMMRGSLLIFTSILSVVILKKKVMCYNWIAVFVVALGLALIGCSAILDQDANDPSSSNVPLGITLTVFGSLFGATQMVVEELLVKGYGAPPEQVVGSEGIWGTLVMLVLLTVMYCVPGADAGSYENAIDSAHMLAGSQTLSAFVGSYLVSIACFNFAGVTIAGKLSAVTRTINDAMRTIIIWAIELMVFYAGDPAYGTSWKQHSWMQLVGFGFLITGNLLNHRIIKVPGLAYPDSELARPLTQKKKRTFWPSPKMLWPSPNPSAIIR